jgi:hypothetical protein
VLVATPPGAGYLYALPSRQTSGFAPCCEVPIPGKLFVPGRHPTSELHVFLYRYRLPGFPYTRRVYVLPTKSAAGVNRLLAALPHKDRQRIVAGCGAGRAIVCRGFDRTRRAHSPCLLSHRNLHFHFHSRAHYQCSGSGCTGRYRLTENVACYSRGSTNSDSTNKTYYRSWQSTLLVDRFSV